MFSPRIPPAFQELSAASRIHDPVTIHCVLTRFASWHTLSARLWGKRSTSSPGRKRILKEGNMKRFALVLFFLGVAGMAYGQDRAESDLSGPDLAVASPSAAPAAPSVATGPVSDDATITGLQAPSVASTTSSPAHASEDYVHETLTRGKWQLGIFGGGGDGLGKSDNTQFMYAGGRVGVVLTGEHLPGWLRGNFQWSADLMPIFVVFPPNSAVYGGSFKPVIWQWNFTSKKKVAPYFAAVGGIIFTRENVPPGDTSQVNFSSGATFGANIFPKRNRALLVEMSVEHISNASLGNHNPGYNGSIFFTVGYSWFRGGH